MEDRRQNRQQQIYRLFKSSFDLAMGVVYLLVSLYASQMPFLIQQYGKTTVWWICALFFGYGLFRIVRSILFFIRNRPF
jgi:hypothetical protein